MGIYYNHFALSRNFWAHCFHSYSNFDLVCFDRLVCFKGFHCRQDNNIYKSIIWNKLQNETLVFPFFFFFFFSVFVLFSLSYKYLTQFYLSHFLLCNFKWLVLCEERTRGKTLHVVCLVYVVLNVSCRCFYFQHTRWKHTERSWTHMYSYYQLDKVTDAHMGKYLWVNHSSGIAVYVIRSCT